MGFLDLFSGAGGSLLGSAANFGFQALANNVLGMSKAQREQNAYASDEAEKARDFNALEAQKSRDFSAQQAEAERAWQEEMYSKYNSLQGKIQQAREAGVNPLFAVTGSAVSSMSAGTPGVSSPSASGPSASPGSVSPVGQVSDIIGAALGFSKLKAEIDNINANTRSQNAQALRDEIKSQFDAGISEATIKESLKRIEVSDADIQVKNEQVREISSKILNQDADTKVKNAQLGQIAADISNLNADTNLKTQQLQQVISSIANTDADTKVKNAQYCEILANTNNLRLTASLITQNTHLSRAQRKEIESRIRTLEQNYDHNEIMYSFQEMAASLEQETIEFYNPQSQLGQACKWILESLVSVISLGGYTSYSTVQSTTNSTSTHIDGDFRPKSSRPIGFK